MKERQPIRDVQPTTKGVRPTFILRGGFWHCAVSLVVEGVDGGDMTAVSAIGTGKTPFDAFCEWQQLERQA